MCVFNFDSSYIASRIYNYDWGFNSCTILHIWKNVRKKIIFIETFARIHSFNNLSDEARL